MKEIEIKTTKTKKVKILPCIECGHDDIKIWDCGYSSFNVAGGTCKGCGHKESIGCCPWNISDEAIVKFWNNKNNPKILKKEYEKEIKAIQKKIDKLPL